MKTICKINGTKCNNDKKCNICHSKYEMHQLRINLDKTVNQARKRFLIKQLNNLGIYYTDNDKDLIDCGLDSLEWMYGDLKE